MSKDTKPEEPKEEPEAKKSDLPPKGAEPVKYNY